METKEVIDIILKTAFVGVLGFLAFALFRLEGMFGLTLQNTQNINAIVNELVSKGIVQINQSSNQPPQTNE